MCESGFPAHDNECVVKCKSTLSVKRNSHRYLLQPLKEGGKIFPGYILLRVQNKDLGLHSHCESLFFAFTSSLPPQVSFIIYNYSG